MTTKRQAQRAAESDLQAFLNEAADRFKPDAANEAQRRADEAAAAERDAMRQRLRDMLLTGATA